MTECEYYQQLISQRLDGELTAEQEHALAEHLSRCADCRTVDAAFRALSEGFADCAEEPPAELCENVMSDIRRENIRRRHSGKKQGWRRLLTAAACFVLVFAAAATAAPMLARKGENVSGAQAVSMQEASYDRAPAEMNDEAGSPIEDTTADTGEVQSGSAEKSGDRMMLASGSGDLAAAQYYNVSDEQLAELEASLAGSPAELPEAEADLSFVVESESDCVYIFIYGERVLYCSANMPEICESAVNSAGLNEILAFFAD